MPGEIAAEEAPVPAGALPDSVAAVVRRAAPRMVRDGFGPLAVFFAGWKLLGLGAGIALAVLFGVAVFVHERRSGQPAVIVRVALVLVAIRAGVGLSSGSATVYLAQEIGIDTLLGCVVLGSLAVGRPFASWFTEEIYPLPLAMRQWPPLAGAMRRITLVWALYFFLRAAVRLGALLTLSTDRYVLVAALSDAPFLIALLAWSVRHAAGVLRANGLLEPLLAAAQSPGGSALS